MSNYFDHLLSLLLTAEFLVCLVVVVTSHDRQMSRGTVSSQRSYVTAADDDNKDVDDETDEDGEQQDEDAEDDTLADEPVCFLVVHSGCLGSVLVGASDWQLDGCKFDSQPPRCRVTTLGKLFTPMCLCRLLLSSGSVPG